MRYCFSVWAICISSFYFSLIFLGLNFLDLFNLKHTVRTIQPCTSLILYFIKRIKMGKTNEMIFCVFSCRIKMLCIGYQHLNIKSCLIQKQLFVVISQGLHINILFITCSWKHNMHVDQLFYTIKSMICYVTCEQDVNKSF